MEELSKSKILDYKRIDKPTDEILEYIDNRRKGKFYSLFPL